MDEPYERLERARELAGYESASDAARALGIREPTYLAHENGSRGFAKRAVRYARFFKVSYEWLMTGRGEPRRQSVDAILAELSVEKQRQVLDFVDFVAGRKN